MPLFWIKRIGTTELYGDNMRRADKAASSARHADVIVCGENAVTSQARGELPRRLLVHAVDEDIVLLENQREELGVLLEAWRICTDPCPHVVFVEPEVIDAEAPRFVVRGKRWQRHEDGV